MVILMAPTGSEVNLLEVMLHAGPVSKSVLVILAAFSLLSWVVIIRKGLLYRRSRAEKPASRNRSPTAFKRATDWREFKQQVEKFSVSPLVGLFVAGYGEVTYQLRQVGQDGKAQLRSMEAVERSLQRASVVEMGRLERSLGGLATVAAVSPFIGLFGTVWVIIDAFRGIGATGAHGLQLLPGPAEAVPDGAGRLLPGVHQPLRAELHLSRRLPLSLDWEDWFQLCCPPYDQPEALDRFECRLPLATERALGLCADLGATATWFCLGDQARRHPALLRRIVGAGHAMG